MRAWRGLAVGLTLGALLAVPAGAAADGGAYIDFSGGTGSGQGGTHFLPGDPVSGLAYVSVPRAHQSLLDRGPFYVYLVPGRGWIQEGKPLPPGTTRLGTATISHDSGAVFAIETDFTVPGLPGAYYTIQICNEPCTISGFRETLSGQISIVQTEREAELLNAEAKLHAKNWSLQRKLRKAGKEIEELSAGLEQSQASAPDATTGEAPVREPSPSGGAAAGRASTDAAGRPIVDGWALVTLGLAFLVALTAVTLALVFTRRHAPRIVVPDTIEGLELEPQLAPAERR